MIESLLYSVIVFHFSLPIRAAPGYGMGRRYCLWQYAPLPLQIIIWLQSMDKRTAKKSSSSWMGFIISICIGLGMIGFTICYSLYPLFDYYGWDEVTMSMQVSECHKKTYRGYRSGKHTVEICNIAYTYTYRGESHSGMMTGNRPSGSRVRGYINPKSNGTPKIYSPNYVIVGMMSAFSLIPFAFAFAYLPKFKENKQTSSLHRRGNE